MGELTIMPARVEDAAEIVPDLAPIDAEELAIIPGGDPVAAIVRSIDMSLEAFTARDPEGRIVAIGGHTPVVMTSSDGVVWLLTTHRARRHGLEIVAKSAAFCDALSARYRQIENLILASNHDVKRWLLRIGFSIGEPAPMRGALVQQIQRTF